MKVTWNRYYCDDDDNEVPCETGVIVPNCCEHVRKHLTVVLAYKYGDLSDEQAYTKPPPAPEGASWQERIKHAVSEVGEPIKGKTRFDVATPIWTVGTAVDHHVLLEAETGRQPFEYPPVLFCPHCGAPMPKIERVPEAEIAGPVHRPVFDGDYCGTCDERSRNCHCLPPEFAWRIVK